MASYLPDKIKRGFFQAAVVSILLIVVLTQHWCTTSTLTKRIERKPDGDCKRMLRVILNKSWKQQPTKQELNSHLLPISKTIPVRQTRQARYCWKCKNEHINYVLLWTPAHGRTSVGRPARTYLQQLCVDTERSLEDLPIYIYLSNQSNYFLIFSSSAVTSRFMH